jgi:hypothetical protein
MSQGVNTEPCCTDGNRVPGLLGRIKHLLDAPMVFGAAPGLEEAAHSVKLEHVLEWKSDFGPDYRGKRHV